MSRSNATGACASAGDGLACGKTAAPSSRVTPTTLESHVLGVGTLAPCLIARSLAAESVGVMIRGLFRRGRLFFGSAFQGRYTCHNARVDFAGEFAAVQSFLSERGYRVAVIGGVALAAYGHPRLTLDLDVVTDAAAQADVVAMMEARGFSTLHRSPGYTNHRHEEHRQGRVDFMYVRDATADQVFASVRQLAGPGGRPIPVPRPEYLIAMKVRAIADAPERMWQDLADIGFLLRLEHVDREEARGYFIRAGLEEKWREIERAL